jgi:hypothetical protein
MKELTQLGTYSGSTKMIRIVSIRNPAVEKLGKTLVPAEKDP